MKIASIIIRALLLFNTVSLQADSPDLSQYDLVWNHPSHNAGESMPCGGGDIGLNVWVENGDLLFYMSRSGTFDENNGFLKLGRMRFKFSPNPWKDPNAFRQILKLQQGDVQILGRCQGQPVKVEVWVDVFAPVIHVDVHSQTPLAMQAIYESWRTADRTLSGRADQSNRSFLGAPIKAVVRHDIIAFEGEDILAYHRNDDRQPNAFDLCVKQQGLTAVKDQLWNPLKNRTFGVLVRGRDMEPGGQTQGRYASTDYRGWVLKSRTPATSHTIRIYLPIAKSDTLQPWRDRLTRLVRADESQSDARQKTLAWWRKFWQRSYVVINPARPESAPWHVGRNVQLFRYQLACNAYGRWPTKFNGGLFTVDPQYTDAKLTFTPDFRRWGGGSFTAQNQRLVYWPMLKSGDVDMMTPQFDFYRRAFKNAELRTRVYWGHRGACFTEQIENFGLPVAFEYGWKRPAGLDPGLQDNAWLAYTWDTSLEFCWMILEAQRYTGKDIHSYLPLIESCLVFFDEHYQKLCQQRTGRPLDENGQLVLTPGSAGETYKMATNPVTTVTALHCVIRGLLALPETYLSADQRAYVQGYLKRVPPLSFRERQGHRTIAPAAQYERVQNVEIPQLYPVFPYHLYGVDRPDLDVAINTWRYGLDRLGQRNIVSWHQDAIFCACLGLTDEATALTLKKMSDSGRRCPTFWGPGTDWVPDHNWGGSGLIGVQDMLMQIVGQRILLLPAWPRDWDVDFKLHAPGNTVVQGRWVHGKMADLKVTPSARRVDVEFPTIDHR